MFGSPDVCRALQQLRNQIGQQELEILALSCDEKRSPTHAEIADTTGIPQSTVQRRLDSTWPLLLEQLCRLDRDRYLYVTMAYAEKRVRGNQHFSAIIALASVVEEYGADDPELIDRARQAKECAICRELGKRAEEASSDKKQSANTVYTKLNRALKVVEEHYDSHASMNGAAIRDHLLRLYAFVTERRVAATVKEEKTIFVRLERRIEKLTASIEGKPDQAGENRDGE